ncbi:unnamed protein product [Calypogeia fissa]
MDAVKTESPRSVGMIARVQSAVRPHRLNTKIPRSPFPPEVVALSSARFPECGAPVTTPERGDLPAVTGRRRNYRRVHRRSGMLVINHRGVLPESPLERGPARANGSPSDLPTVSLDAVGGLGEDRGDQDDRSP